MILYIGQKPLLNGLITISKLYAIYMPKISKVWYDKKPEKYGITYDSKRK